MQIRLDNVRDEPFAWQEQLTVPVDRLDNPDLDWLGPVSVEGRVEWVDPDFLLRVRYGYQQRLLCMRCLQPAEESREGELELIVEVGGQMELPGEVQLESTDLGLLRIASETLETDTIVLEQLQLNIPMKALCRPDCKGICGGCGVDLNRDVCRCEQAPVDPRWSALAALKDDSSGEND